jgi:UDP-N-acetylglucosamine 2-epimerase (non-hydrolysing)
MVPIILELKRRKHSHPNLECIVCVTAQHRQLLDQVLNLFEVVPDHDLNLMQHNQGLMPLTSLALVKLQPLLAEIEPDMVLVHGDTTTTFAASLAAFYNKIPVGHVEAGLRTGNIYSPWPEEMNRKLTTALSTYHFAPTQSSADNLSREGVPSASVLVSGNTVIDALKHVRSKLNTHPTLAKNIASGFDYIDDSKKLLLVTVHRREQFGQTIEGICEAFKVIASRNDVQIVYAVHPNPNITEPVERLLGDIENVVLIKPLEYVDFVYLLDKAHVVLTDSGGIQEEAASIGKPTLILREFTERPDGISAGVAELVGTSPEKIVRACARLLDDEPEYRRRSVPTNAYGDGMASSRIADFVISQAKYR